MSESRGEIPGVLLVKLKFYCSHTAHIEIKNCVFAGALGFENMPC